MQSCPFGNSKLWTKNVYIFVILFSSQVLPSFRIILAFLSPIEQHKKIIYFFSKFSTLFLFLKDYPILQYSVLSIKISCVFIRTDDHSQPSSPIKRYLKVKIILFLPFLKTQKKIFWVLFTFLPKVNWNFCTTFCLSLFFCKGSLNCSQ